MVVGDGVKVSPPSTADIRLELEVGGSIARIDFKGRMGAIVPVYKDYMEVGWFIEYWGLTFNWVPKGLLWHGLTQG